MFRKSAPHGWLIHSLTIALVLVCLVGAVAGCSRDTPLEGELQRLLGYLPPPASGAAEMTISFSEVAAIKRRHGFAEEVASADVPASMMDDFLKAVEAARGCASLDAYVQKSHTQMDIGYDAMVVQRCITGGGVTVWEGNLDRDYVAASLKSLGYAEDGYQGVATYHFSPASYTGDEVGRELAATFGHVAVVKGAVITTATSEQLRAALDIWKGRAKSLADVAQYVELAHDLGVVFNARLSIRGDQVTALAYQEATIDISEPVLLQRSKPSCTSPMGQESMGGQWYDAGSSEDVRYLVLASTYATAAEAETAGKSLVECLGAYPDADRWEQIGEPSVSESKNGAILVLVVMLKDDAPGGLPPDLASVWP